jgi:hypothetical protein
MNSIENPDESFTYEVPKISTETTVSKGDTKKPETKVSSKKPTRRFCEGCGNPITHCDCCCESDSDDVKDDPNENRNANDCCGKVELWFCSDCNEPIFGAEEIDSCLCNCCYLLKRFGKKHNFSKCVSCGNFNRSDEITVYGMCGDCHAAINSMKRSMHCVACESSTFQTGGWCRPCLHDYMFGKCYCGITRCNKQICYDCGYSECICFSAICKECRRISHTVGCVCSSCRESTEQILECYVCDRYEKLSQMTGGMCSACVEEHCGRSELMCKTCGTVCQRSNIIGNACRICASTCEVCDKLCERSDMTGTACRTCVEKYAGSDDEEEFELLDDALADIIDEPCPSLPIAPCLSQLPDASGYSTPRRKNIASPVCPSAPPRRVERNEQCTDDHPCLKRRCSYCMDVLGMRHLREPSAPTASGYSFVEEEEEPELLEKMPML